MKDSSTSGNVFAVVAIVMVIALLGGFIYWYQNQASQEPSQPVAVPEPIPAPSPAAPEPAAEPVAAEPEPIPPAEPEPRPVQEPEKPAPQPELPALNDSDSFVSEQIAPVANAELTSLIVPDEIVRKTVRAVIGVANNRLVNQYRPVLSPLPTLGVSQISGGIDAEYELTEANYRRYDKHIALMESIDPATLASLLNTLEPLFDEAYAEQGLTGNFRQVLIDAIDNILATPEVEKTLILKRPAVMYKYADPELEALPEPQKLMLRIGPDNRAKVKSYLSALKEHLSSP